MYNSLTPHVIIHPFTPMHALMGGAALHSVTQCDWKQLHYVANSLLV